MYEDYDFATLLSRDSLRHFAADFLLSMHRHGRDRPQKITVIWTTGSSSTLRLLLEEEASNAWRRRAADGQIGEFALIFGNLANMWRRVKAKKAATKSAQYQAEKAAPVSRVHPDRAAMAAAPPQRAAPAQRPVTNGRPRDDAPGPSKKPKNDAPFDVSAAVASSMGNNHAKPAAAGAASAGAGNKKAPQYISSLFSFNPEVSAPVPVAPAPSNAAPSNAPLADTSTFQGLGLDPLLVRHLQNKMAIERPTRIQRACLPGMLAAPAEAQMNDEGMVIDDPQRDVFIQSQTGSGKTLSYLLPIIQSLLPLSRLSYIDRSIGTLAIILVPTRELAQQISKVVDQILSMALSLPDADPESSERPLTRWLVSGLLTGGSTRTHEKARLRKGLPILVSTPGRLLDHLQNTSSFQCAKTLWLVLDEADRLMELGFEDTVLGIVKALEGRRRIEREAEEDAIRRDEGGVMKWDWWGRGRRTVLCSATVREDVQKLAGVALKNPVVYKGTDVAELDGGLAEPKLISTVAGGEDASAALQAASEEKFTPPSQLSQKYVVAPLKLRLVSLVALLRSLVAKESAKVDAKGKGMKVIVFLSCTDSVDFHWKLLSGVNMSGEEEAEEDDEDEVVEGLKGTKKVYDESDSEVEVEAENPKTKKKAEEDEPVALESTLFPSTKIFRLHGSLPLRTRMASLKGFSAPSGEPSILLCTSVASRGLDMPLVRAVVQYDLPTEGGATEYVHRVGRTARVGRGGEAWAFVGTGEVDWIPWVEEKMGLGEGQNGKPQTGDAKGVRLVQVGVEEVLRKGFGGRGHEYEGRATEVQLAFEKWVLQGGKVSRIRRSNADSSMPTSRGMHSRRGSRPTLLTPLKRSGSSTSRAFTWVTSPSRLLFEKRPRT